jgi:hypothetical protein
MSGILNELVKRRKSYSFQIMKLIYMFPDDSFSSTLSVNKYDRLIFSDQQLHTLLKIYETK